VNGSHGRRPAVAALAIAALAIGCSVAATGSTRTTETFTIRGQAQTLHTYGMRGGTPVIVSSGDGGWIHLGPHIAETLAAHGFFVVGFDVKSYLSGFTSASGALRPDDVPGDYEALVAFARAGSPARPVLIGVSEGAGLSVLAAADSRIHRAAEGVIGVGLPQLNELGWRWRDSLIYVTHAVPNEPTFETAAVVSRVAPLPLASIRSTHDAFVTAADTARIVAAAAEPKRLWTIDAADHGFSDHLDQFDSSLLEALAWVHERAAR
jgi:type IV secretory pathway VirJ component